MTESNSSVAPGDPSGLEMSLEIPEEDIDAGDVWKAQKIAGSLIWLSTRTRLDISYGQSRVSSMATTNPKQAILEGKRILRYLRGTADYALYFKPTDNTVIAYGDASFAIKRSQTGTIIKIGDNTVCWRSSKQPQVAKSTADSEVTAMASTAILGDYVKTLRESLFIPTPYFDLKCDNRAAIVLATGEGSWKTKALANRVQGVKEAVERGEIFVTYIGTREQAADCLTKFLPGPMMSDARKQMSLYKLKDFTPPTPPRTTKRIAAFRLKVGEKEQRTPHHLRGSVERERERERVP